MAQHVQQLMTANPVALPAHTAVRHAAQQMRDHDIGDVIVLDGDRLCGLVTDRDLVVRAVTERDDLSDCTLGEVCSQELVTADPDEDTDTAIQRMREHALRRIPVVTDGHPVGMFSLGDAATTYDRHSALGDISAAPGNT